MVGRRGEGRHWSTGGKATAASGAPGSRKGDRAVIPATRLTQSICGRLTRCTTSVSGCATACEDAAALGCRAFRTGADRPGLSRVAGGTCQERRHFATADRRSGLAATAGRRDLVRLADVAESGRNRGQDSVCVFWPRPAREDDAHGILPGSSGVGRWASTSPPAILPPQGGILGSRVSATLPLSCEAFVWMVLKEGVWKR